MSVAKLVGYTLLVNVGLVAALGANGTDDPDVWTIDVSYNEPPPTTDDVENVEDRSTLLGAQHVDPVLARAQAIELARTSSLLSDPRAVHLMDLLDESDISSGFECGRVYGLEIQTTPPSHASPTPSWSSSTVAAATCCSR